MDVEAIRSVLEEAVGSGAAPGLCAAVLAPDGSSLTLAAGARGAADPAPLPEDAMFWIASCTKAVTSAAALQLVDQGRLDLDEPCGRLLPELAAPKVIEGFDAAGEPILRPARRPVTLRALLTHTSGLAYDFCSEPLKRYFTARGLTLFAAGLGAPLAFEPGEGWVYGTGIDAAAHMIEAATGLTLGEQLSRAIFQPLGMTDATFEPTHEQTSRIAGLSARTPQGLVAAPPMSSMPRLLRGGGGLCTTAGDYLKFLSAVAGGGAGVFSPRVLGMLRAAEAAWPGVGDLISLSPAISHDFLPMPGLSKAATLGFLQNLERSPDGRSAGSLAWAGITNCYYWADPAAGAAGVLFSQLMPFADPQVLAAFARLERAVYGIERPAAAARAPGVSTPAGAA